MIGNGIEILAAEDVARLRELSVLSYRTVTADGQTLPVPTTYMIGPHLRDELTQMGVLTDFVFPMFGAGQQDAIASLAL